MINPDRLTVKSGEALNEAIAEARRLGNPVVYDTHLLSVLLGQDESIVVPVLQKLGASVAALREALQRELARYPRQSDAQPTISRELTEAARQGKLDPVIGRDEEIRRVVQVLSRRTKNNPVLIGEPGVGKTA